MPDTCVVTPEAKNNKTRTSISQKRIPQHIPHLHEVHRASLHDICWRGSFVEDTMVSTTYRSQKLGLKCALPPIGDHPLKASSKGAPQTEVGMWEAFSSALTESSMQVACLQNWKSAQLRRYLVDDDLKAPPFFMGKVSIVCHRVLEVFNTLHFLLKTWENVVPFVLHFTTAVCQAHRHEGPILFFCGNEGDIEARREDAKGPDETIHPNVFSFEPKGLRQF